MTPKNVKKSINTTYGTMSGNVQSMTPNTQTKEEYNKSIVGQGIPELEANLQQIYMKENGRLTSHKVNTIKLAVSLHQFKKYLRKNGYKASLEVNSYWDSLELLISLPLGAYELMLTNTTEQRCAVWVKLKGEYEMLCDLSIEFHRHTIFKNVMDTIECILYGVAIKA